MRKESSHRANPRRAHTSKGAIDQISRHLISSFTCSANMKNAETFTYPNIHRLRCAATMRGYSCTENRILFSWGISSVFKSDRVLAINDDAVFLGGRAALIIQTITWSRMESGVAQSLDYISGCRQRTLIYLRGLSGSERFLRKNSWKSNMAGWRARLLCSCTGCSVIENGTAFGSHLLLFRHVGQCGCTLHAVVDCSDNVDRITFLCI